MPNAPWPVLWAIRLSRSRIRRPRSSKPFKLLQLLDASHADVASATRPEARMTAAAPRSARRGHSIHGMTTSRLSISQPQLRHEAVAETGREVGTNGRIGRQGCCLTRTPPDATIGPVGNCCR
ncbi:hypothetical protein LZ30DRAFT_42626 [Colletotrichum cereale]|nr:hypothetical protein LZ30DRAFT_42626 [Colletotrichum cereale]